MGNCGSKNAKTNVSGPKGLKKFVRPRMSDEELTEVDFDRLKEEARQRQLQEEEMNRLIYAEKAALKEITSRLIEKRASCESLMDLLEPAELVDISLDDSSFRAQKRVRRKLMMKHQDGDSHEWMLYNNVDGIAEPHMVHLALFMQKVMTTLSRIEAIKTNQSQRHAKSEAQLTKLQMSPKGNVMIAPVTPPSSPIGARMTSGVGSGGRAGRKALQRIAEHHTGSDDGNEVEGAGSNDRREQESHAPFRTASCDSMEIPTDAATLAIIEQQRRLEEDYLRSQNTAPGEAAASSADSSLPAPPEGFKVADPADTEEGENKFLPPSPPPSLDSSPRSMASAPVTPTGSPRIGSGGGYYGDGGDNDTANTDTGASAAGTDTSALLTGASLCLRLGELISPEDEQLLSGVQQGTSDLLENVRSSKSHADAHNALANVSSEMLAQYRRELLSLQVCIIAPQTSYEITQANLYDYDLPPGLVTLRVAHTIMQLYRRGGRLTPKSVHKLLRLGYRSLHKKANTTHVSVQPGESLTIVGDLHGQLPDLLHILQTSGLPSRTNKYIFNGDFVDRGAYGVEVMCTLLALHIAMPDHVILNRGNHEDFAICTAYGFQMECSDKYGDVIFGMFVEIFQQLPLFAIVNQTVLVLHGGLFHTTDTSLAELNAIDRAAFSLQDIPEGGDGIHAISRGNREQYLKQLVRDALWSDPADHDGLKTSVRGAGVSFGADITRAFLRANDLKFIVRSHECVRSGYDEPYSGADKKLLCTIFSASDYGGSGNAAAILQFHVPTEKELAAHQAKVEAAAATAAEEGEEKKADTFMNLADAIQQMEQAEEAPLEYTELKFVPDTDLCYRVHHYFVAPNFFDQEVGAALLDAHQSTTDLTALHTLQNSGAVAQQEGATAAAAAAVNEEQSTGTAIAAGGGGGGGDGGRGPASLAAAGRSISLPIAAGRRQSLDHDGLPLSAASTSSPTGTDMTLSPPDFSSGSGRFARSRSLTAGTTTGAGNLNFAHMLGSVDFDDEAGANDGLVVSDKDCVLIGSRTSLFEFIVSRLDELTKEFESVDKRGSGVVSKYQWVNVMREVMSLHIRWIALMQVLVLESHFRIYHGKKMVDYRLFLNSFREDDEDPGEDFGGELVADEYTAAHSTASAASHTSDSETVTTTGAVVNEEIDHAQGSSSAEGKVESKTENGAQNNAPFSSAGTASNGSSEEVNTDKETPSVGSPRDDTPPVAQQLVVVEVKEVAEGAKEATFGTSPTATSRKKVSFVCTDEEAEESASAPTTGFSPSSTSNNNGNGNNSMDGFSSSPDSTLSSSSKGFASPDTLGTPSPRTRRVSSSAKLGRRNSESLIRSVDVSPPVLLPTQMYCSHRISRELMEVLYIDYKEVEGAFNFFDRDHDGFISAAEFRATCKELNKYLPRGQKIRDIDSMLMLMDFEETGEIAFNNFFELFRLSEMKLNVGIDDEDSLHSSLHHSDVRDIGRQHSISGYGSFSAGAPSKLAIHGVQINVDSEFPAPRSPTAAALAAAAAAAAAASSPTAAAAGAGTRGLGTEESKLARGDSPLGLNIDA